jgi:hypothetical protein
MYVKCPVLLKVKWGEEATNDYLQLNIGGVLEKITLKLVISS